MPKNQDVYLFDFSSEELEEIYQSLALRDELKRRLEPEANTNTAAESKLLRRFATQISDRQSHKLREEITDELDHYIDHEIDDQMMWQGIEDELRRRFEE